MTSTSISQPGEGRLDPSRIQLARERRGLSKVKLARTLGLTTRALQVYECDGAPPSRAKALASALGVEPGFFALQERHAVSAEQGFFRARRRATAAQLSSARAAAAIGAELYDWIAERFSLPGVLVPDLDPHAPETAAGGLRASWGRGDEPLPNLIQLSEAHGVRVMSLPIDAATVDAFSFWLDGAPYVFLSTRKSAERSRFDLAHELGHLVMHSRTAVASDDVGPSDVRTLEREADEFAAALLMPRMHLLAHAGREPAVPQILRLREHYRVSAMAMAYRLHHLGRMTDWAYRQNCSELSRRGFRSDEPGGMDREQSRVFATVFPALRQQGIGPPQVGEVLGLPVSELHGLTFGHVPMQLHGDGRSGSAVRPDLHLMDGG